ncbi:MAG: hypothetical protein ACOVOW_00600 [Spirosomataceae bacterium]
MQQLILKTDIDATKMEALLFFLKSWNIDAELKTTPMLKEKKQDFSLAVGMWEDYDINANELRKQAWNRNR